MILEMQSVCLQAFEAKASSKKCIVPKLLPLHLSKNLRTTKSFRQKTELED